MPGQENGEKMEYAVSNVDNLRIASHTSVNGYPTWAHSLPREKPPISQFTVTSAHAHNETAIGNKRDHPHRVIVTGYSETVITLRK